MSDYQDDTLTKQEEPINIKTHWREKIRNYLRFNTFRVTFLAVVIALNLVMAVFSKFVMALIPIWDFLVVEITFFTYLIVAFTINTLYAFVMVAICTWIRIPMLNDEWVGTLAMNISDALQLIITMSIYFLLKPYLFPNNEKKKVYVAFLIAFIIAALVNATLNVLWNYIFLLPMYKKMYYLDLTPVLNEYLPVVFGFNVLKYSINNIIFMLLLRVLIVLNKKY